MIRTACYIAMLLLTVTACNSGSGAGRDSVWDTYDYRYAPPGDVGMPPIDYNYGYEDNDSSYQAPSNFGCDPDNMMMCK